MGMARRTVTHKFKNQNGAASEFHTPKAVTYHEPTVMRLFMIGHSLGRMEMWFALGTFGGGGPNQNTSRIQIL